MPKTEWKRGPKKIRERESGRIPGSACTYYFPRTALPLSPTVDTCRILIYINFSLLFRFPLLPAINRPARLYAQNPILDSLGFSIRPAHVYGCARGPTSQHEERETELKKVHLFAFVAFSTSQLPPSK